MLNKGVLNITNSAFSGNFAVLQGGSIATTLESELNAADTEFSRNYAQYGGAVASYAAVALLNVTATANAAQASSLQPTILVQAVPLPSVLRAS